MWHASNWIITWWHPIILYSTLTTKYCTWALINSHLIRQRCVDASASYQGFAQILFKTTTKLKLDLTVVKALQWSEEVAMALDRFPLQLAQHARNSWKLATRPEYAISRPVNPSLCNRHRCMKPCRKLHRRPAPLRTHETPTRRSFPTSSSTPGLNITTSPETMSIKLSGRIKTTIPALNKNTQNE
jgi:hypothetical protein